MERALRFICAKTLNAISILHEYLGRPKSSQELMSQTLYLLTSIFITILLLARGIGWKHASYTLELCPNSRS
ncbi:hypothetical protein K431DRAFT_65416 [Polychaeton citri CBS 116435]|uniref:Uncharacterized protein n=1 Tax=Polychaeton citri CBS 116435 TaxID=1314669 RepID=A0A9P4Q8Y0_9PEZI|nr:hypothetical protein K431DRAFT_65416 [Polychaeton citri CBS 116435]